MDSSNTPFLVVILLLGIELNSCSSFYDLVDLKDEQIIIQSKKIVSVNKLSKEYQMHFDVKLTSMYTTVVTNVLRFMANDQDNNDNVLGFWIYSNGSMKFTSRINSSTTFQFTSKTRIPLFQWIRIATSQAFFNGFYTFSVSVNGTVECTRLKGTATDLDNVKVYTSDPFNYAQPGSVRNLFISALTPDIDECASSGSSICNKSNSLCINTYGSYYCSCFDGWVQSLDKKSCIDIDECAYNGSSLCNWNDSLCINTYGSYYCSCTLGLVLNSEGEKCIDVDECAFNESSFCNWSKSLCINTNGSYYCTCMDGWALSSDKNSCIDIDECAYNGSSLCNWNESLCVNTYGSYYCSCMEGWVLNSDKNSCISMNVDECVYNGSSFCNWSKSICVNTNGNYYCTCMDGWALSSDKNSCIDIDECAYNGSSVCNWSKSLCVNTNGSYYCTCMDGWMLSSDKNSCIDIDECAYSRSSVCNWSKSRCVNTNGSYYCTCMDGWMLSSVKNSCIDVDECAYNGSSVCNWSKSICVNTNGSYYCTCMDGWALSSDKNSCIDIDECAYNGSSICNWRKSLCVNTNGSYYCTCMDGWMLSSVKNSCIDIDECAYNGSSICNWSKSRCVNTNGSYYCTCMDGWMLSSVKKSCIDVDECAYNGSSVCNWSKSICVNTNGSYYCTCMDGWALSSDKNSCIDVDECAYNGSSVCNWSKSICVNTNGSYFCTCMDGWALSSDKNSCIEVPSINDVSLLVEENLHVNNTFKTIVTVFNGSNMMKNTMLQLDFGDKSSPVIMIINITNTHNNSYTFFYSYSKCGKYQISVFIKDNQNSTMENISTNVSVIVFCYLSPMNITTDSTMYINRTLLVLKRKEVSLYIKQDFEWNVHYAIDWGDGFNESFDLSDNLKLLPFVCTHAYSDVGKHVILVVASNGVYSFNKSIDVLVRNCTVPMVNFYYGTKTNPIYFLQGVDKTFIASVDEISEKCKRQPSSFEWALTSSGLELKSKAALVKQKVVYTVKKQQLQAGSYALSLLFTYGDIESVYTTYFVVVKSPLFVEAENGVSFRNISYKKKVGNDSINANFTINANGSYDPDNQTAGLDGILFKWRCQLATDLAYAFAHLNKTANSSVDGNTCFNSSWVDLTDLTGPEVVFNTGMFYESFSYRFEVVGTKGIGEDFKIGSFVHEIFFSKEIIPDIQLSCFTNCGRKLNIQEPTVFFYKCSDCGNQGLVASWKVLEENGDTPGKMIYDTFDSSFLVINSDVLLQAKNYTFYIEIGYLASSYKALFRINKQTSSSPIPGICYVNPHNGFSIMTKFKLVCQDWTDLDGSILNYHFYYGYGEANNNYLTLNSKSVDQPSMIGFVLGAGEKSTNFSVTIHIKINGIYNTMTEYDSLTVQVLPNDNLLNFTDILLGVDPNDTEIVTNIIQSFAISINAYSKAVENLVMENKDNLTGMFLIDEELNQRRTNDLDQLQKVRSDVINFISLTSLSDMSDFKSVADILYLLTNTPKQLLQDTQEVAVDTLVKMTRLLKIENIKNLNFNEFLDIAKPFLNTASNLFNANSYLVNQIQTFDVHSTPDVEATVKVTRSAHVVKSLLQSLDDVFYAVHSYKAPVENATIFDTSEFSFVANKRFANSLSGIAIGMPPNFDEDISYGFTFPVAENILNASVKDTIILFNNLRMKNQPFTWNSEMSQNIVSESEHLSLSTPERLPIELKNLQQPIIIAIKNIPEKLIGQNISLLMPEDAQVYSVVLTSDSCNMMLNFRPLNDPENLTTLIVYIQYGKVPSKNDYDIKLVINNDGTVLSNNFQTVTININATYGNTIINKYSNISVNQSTSNNETSLPTKRHQQARLLKDGNLILWSFQNSTYAFLNKTALFFSLSYLGPIPNKIIEENPYTFDEKEYNGKFEYELKSFCSKCSYWDETKNKWMSDGCELDIETTTFSTTVCKCTHLTAFAGFYVKPNVLPTPSLLLIKQGYVLFVVVGSILLIWILGLVITRKIDKKDTTKIGICPLLDNRKEDNYMYQITVNTGNRRNAGTKSNIFFTVVGELEDSGVRRLKDSKRYCFQRSSSDTFIMTTSGCLGNLCYIRLWHDNKGGGWYLRNIEIVDLQTQMRFHFLATRWLSVDHEKCSLDCVLPVTESEELSQFDHLFSMNIRNNFFENHLWFSIFARPPGSSFTCCQRLSVAVCLLMTGMTSSTMFFGQVPSGTASTENKIEGFAIKWHHIYLAFINGCITTPINLIFVGLFRQIKLFNQDLAKNSGVKSLFPHETGGFLHSSSMIPHVETRDTNSRSKSISIDLDNLEHDVSKRKMKENIKLPHWFLYVIWFFCVGTILSCGFIVLLYGMSFGNKKSLDWLATVMFSLAQDVLLFQPIKIFAVALFSALSIKVFGARRKYFININMHGNALEFDEKLLYQPKQEATIFERNDIDTNPPDKVSVLAMQESRLKQLRLNQISHELVLYTCFAFLVFFISYFSRESLAYFHTDNVKKLFNLKSSGADVSQPLDQLRSADDFWYWLDNCLLPQAFPDPWYKNREDFPGKLFLNDLTSKIVNGIRIRQVRVKHDSCFKAESVSEFFVLECLSAYKLSVEEKQDFAFNWTKLKQYSVPINPSTKPWRYQNSNQLDGYPVSATLETYFGGGYVIEIFPKWKNDEILDQVKQRRWIDRQTRVVFIEFALYNAATTNFDMVNIIFEFPPSGGMVPSYSVTPFKLYESSENKMIMRASQAIFILMMFFFSVREIKLMHKCGGKYFHEFWNLVEVALVLLSMLAVFFYYYRGELAKQITERLSDRHPQVYINLQLVSYCDLSYTYVTSIIVFFVNIKFIKMLRFNRRIFMLSSTLKGAWPALSMFGIIFAIILCAIVFSSCIIFGILLHGYQDYFQTIASVVSLLLGKFDFHQFEEANAFLGPIFFFGFNIVVNWIIVNMFISILNDSFEMARLNNAMQNEDYDLIDFLRNKLNGWFYKLQQNAELHNNSSVLACSIPCVDHSNTETNKLCYDLQAEVLFSKYEYLLQDENQENFVMNETLSKFIRCMKILEINTGSRNLSTA